MFARSFRRGLNRRLLRNVSVLTCLLLLLDLWISLNRYKTFERTIAANTVTRIEDLPHQARNQKIFIVAQFWTSADVIVEFWQDALVGLIDTLGAQNVYVSILSSGGLDNTGEVLRYMDEHVLGPRGIPRSVIIDPTTHKDEIEAGPVDTQGNGKPGWILTGDSQPPGQKELRRIPYLAGTRNRGLEPLFDMHQEKGIIYDKILYLNDVMFQTSDVLSLLATNDGTYDVACAFDFHYPPAFYDTFALRDDEGYPAATASFPFYRSSTTRHAILKGLPAPVKSCWNGMVVADASPYYDTHTSSSDTHVKGLRYRGIPDSLAATHLEASECCLIHADLIARGQANHGLYMNPAVRVAYPRDSTKYPTTAYQDTHIGPNGLRWVTANEYIFGIWQNRLARWQKPGWWDSRLIMKKIDKWSRDGSKAGETREEVGAYCVIDEMHILIWNGWKHVW